MLYEDGVTLIKFWFSISKDEQKKRFESRQNDPLKQWKFSPVDVKGQELWDSYTYYREQMFGKTHTDFSPWVIVETNDKRTARLESMRYVLSQFNYRGQDHLKHPIVADPNVVHRYYRSNHAMDS
jgi:polyphosphate kinase 2 (PPK2 family)